MKSLGIYEVKTKITQIFQEVSESKEPILVTRRGVPIVKIVPVATYRQPASPVWEAREGFENDYGLQEEELLLPERRIEAPSNPFQEDE